MACYDSEYHSGNAWVVEAAESWCAGKANLYPGGKRSDRTDLNQVAAWSSLQNGKNFFGFCTQYTISVHDAPIHYLLKL